MSKIGAGGCGGGAGGWDRRLLHRTRAVSRGERPSYTERGHLGDPLQSAAWSNVGWDLLRSAGLDPIARLLPTASSVALPQLITEGLIADAAFIDGSHRFHEVFVDLYFLRKIVRPGRLIIVDDYWAAPVRTAVHYYEQNLGWEAVPGAFAGGTAIPGGGGRRATPVTRCRAFRLPDPPFEPSFEEFVPF
jgi:hypothetical protein